MLYNDSIREHLSKDSLVAELKMQLSSPQNLNRTMILFEGEDDISVFNSLIDNDGCMLFESYGGKAALNEIITSIINDKRLIGIRDRDYEANPLGQRIFFCDHCNLEMMIVSNNESFSNSMFKIVRQGDDFLKLREDVLLAIKGLSITRKLNEELQWHISFKGISVNYLLTLSNPIKVKDLILYLNSINANMIDDQQMDLIITEMDKLTSHPLDYTNGHDYCQALVFFLKTKYTNKGIKTIGAKDFSTFLYLGYHEKHFKKTSLYNSLVLYQNQEKLSIVL